jgi:alkylation response protein AidB-like acyl-CoA dehydrogenase
VALNMHRIGVDLTATLPPFPRRNAVLEDIARNGALICAPGSIPTGELDNRKSGFRAVEDGANLVVSGRAGFASASEGARYVFLVSQIDRGTNAEGQPNDPDFVFALPEIDTPGLKLLYNWDAMGLRGTASHDVECDGLVIPRTDTLVLPLAMLRAVFEAVQQQAGTAAQRRSLGTLGILAIWLGLSQAAFDFTVEYVRQRHGYLAGAVSVLGAPPGYRSEQPWAQSAIGNMEHWLETGRIIFYDTVRRLDEPFAGNQEFTRHLVRTVYHLRRMTEEVALGAMKTCGAHAYVRTRPLERIVRDMLGGVVMAWKTDELVQTLGRGALGLPITIVGPAGS